MLALLFAATLAGALPNPAVTPGAVDPSVTQENIQTTICVPGYSRSVRPPSWYTSRLKHNQLAAHGIFGRMREFEEDHLIPLELGGAPRDPSNLWPEPRAGRWTAERKDVLENELHRMVCEGTMPLRAAQSAFRSDWTAVYRRYIRD